MTDKKDARKLPLMQEIRFLQRPEDPTKVYPQCIRHGWIPTTRGKPTEGCPACWFCWYLLIGSELGEEWIDGAESAVHHMLEQLYGGTWDARFYSRPEVRVENDSPEKIKLVN